MAIEVAQEEDCERAVLGVFDLPQRWRNIYF